MAETSRKALEQQRFAAVRQMYPSIDLLDWERVFNQDPAIMGSIIGDIMKAAAAEGTTGRRPHLGSDASSGPQLRQLMGEDHTLLPFTEAFRLLVRDLHLSTVSAKTGIPKTKVWRLLHGHATPSADDMEKIAVGFKRHPSFFAEWRVNWVLALLGRRLERLPEATVGYYRRLSPGHD